MRLLRQPSVQFTGKIRRPGEVADLLGAHRTAKREDQPGDVRRHDQARSALQPLRRPLGLCVRGRATAYRRPLCHQFSRAIVQGELSPSEAVGRRHAPSPVFFACILGRIQPRVVSFTASSSFHSSREGRGSLLERFFPPPGKPPASRAASQWPGSLLLQEPGHVLFLQPDLL